MTSPQPLLAPSPSVQEPGPMPMADELHAWHEAFASAVDLQAWDYPARLRLVDQLNHPEGVKTAVVFC